jgi:outer membrane protein TolC
MLAQSFPWFGTLETRGDKARAEAEAALARLYAARNEIFSAVKTAYVDYAFLGEGIQVTESQVEILEYTENIVSSRFGLGMSAQEDLLRIQIEQTKLQDRYDGLMQFRPALAARLNEALGRQAASDPPWPEAIPLPPEAPPAPIVLARLRVNNPMLAESDHLIESMSKDVELAKKSRYPNFTVAIEYIDMKDPRNPGRTGPFLEMLDSFRMWTTPVKLDLPPAPNPSDPFVQKVGTLVSGARSLRQQTRPDTLGGLMSVNRLVEVEEAFDNAKRQDEVMVSVNVNVPIWRKRINAAIAEAKHMESAAEHEKLQRTIALEAASKMALFEMQDGLRRYNLYESTLIPQAQQTYEAVQTTYASGSADADFLDVLESVQTLLDFQLEQLEAARDLHIAAAELERILGGPWAGVNSEAQIAPANEPVEKVAEDTTGEKGKATPIDNE